MFAWVAAAAAVLGGAGYACGRGIVRAKGQTEEVAPSFWRVRWACWRWVTEIKTPADDSYQKIGSSPSEAAAISMGVAATMPPPQGSSFSEQTNGPTIKLTGMLVNQ